MRLTWIALVFVALVVGSVSPSYAQAADKPTKTFEGDAAVALVYVKADKTADFEDLMAKFKEALSKSEVAEVKQQTAGLKIFKAPNGPAPAGAALYVMIADPVVKNVEYLVPLHSVQGVPERRAGPVPEVDRRQGGRVSGVLRPDGGQVTARRLPDHGTVSPQPVLASRAPSRMGRWSRPPPPFSRFAPPPRAACRPSSTRTPTCRLREREIRRPFSGPSARPSPTAATAMNVLVADDDRVTRLILGRILAAEFGCSVTEVPDGTDALEALTTQPFDLLLLDLQMPVMGGLDVMRALRQAPSLDGLPVVVLTADRSEETVRQVREFGVVDYLTKPLDAERIVSRLRRVLTRPAGEEEPAAVPGPEPVVGQGGAVLVIDGHLDFRHAFTAALGPRWVVREAESGVRGLRLAVEDPPGAAVIGEDLGVLSEPLLVKKLRSLPTLRDVPLIAVVANRDAAAERLRSYDASVVRSTNPALLLEQFEELTRSGAPLGGAERCPVTTPGGEPAPAA